MAEIRGKEMKTVTGEPRDDSLEIQISGGTLRGCKSIAPRTHEKRRKAQSKVYP
jgi:hypothetical protein